MKKPSIAIIRSTRPLTANPERGQDPLSACNVCGGTPGAEGFRVWRECDEFDRPRSGPEALVFVVGSHEACLRVITDHPRLYIEDRGEPGTFPRLCGRCTHRQGTSCTHPDLRANGGPGLRVGLSGFANMIICRRGTGGCENPIKHALDCEGQRLPGEP